MKTKILFTVILLTIYSGLIAQIIHVPGDQTTIQDGIGVANNGDTVLVEDGNYLENINFLGKAITVASLFLMDGDTNHINNTIIDGSEPNDPNFGSTVTFLTGEDTTSILYGFTITGGSGMYLSTDNVWIGGGIVCYYAGAKIASNKIIDNEVTGFFQAAGGGIGCFYDIGEIWVIIENNSILENECHATNDIALGGGIYIACNARIKNNLIKHNICSSDLYNAEGGGIATCNLFGDADNVYIINNTITSNSVWGYDITRGGGVVSKLSHTYFQNNIISYNEISGDRPRGGGISIVEGETTNIVDNIISYNTITANSDKSFWGPGVCCAQPSGETIIQNNEFSNNSGPSTGPGTGGGLSILGASENKIIVDANMFLNNNAYHGGGFYEKYCYNLLLTNNVFSGNSANERGGAIGIWHPEQADNHFPTNSNDNIPQIINNTFYSNSSVNEGGALRFSGDLRAPIIFNCIFWGNEAPNGNDILNTTTEPLIVSFSDIDTNGIVGVWIGEGNINLDPEFIDPAAGNYCIDSCYSPCTGSGIDTLFIDEDIWFLGPDHDILGRSRPMPISQQPDMGAYEVDSCLINNTANFQALSCKVQIFPNPSFGISDIRYRIPVGSHVTLYVYDIHGQKIRTLVDENQPAGEYVVRFDGSDLTAGIYFVRLQAGDQAESTKLIITH